MDDEIRLHLEQRADDLVRRGMTPADASRRARVEFGAVEAWKDDMREAVGLRIADELRANVRYAFRQLRRSPIFTISAAITLALGIGANTAIFSLVSWLVLRPLSAQRPEQLVFLAFPQSGSRFDSFFSLEEYRQIRAASSGVLSDVGLFHFGGAMDGVRGSDGLTADGTTQPVQTVFVSGNFFSILGIQPALGRFFLPFEGATLDSDPVVVISYQYWRSRFALNPSIVGKHVAINGRALTVVGIAPKDFHGVTPIIDMQAYLPLGMSTVEGPGAANWFGDPRARPLLVFGRLRDGVSALQAEAELSGMASQLQKEHQRQQVVSTLKVRPLRPPGLMNGPNPLPKLAAIFLTLAGLLLMLAAINVTNLLLVRAGARRHEMSVRAALGAGRSRLVRQMLTESLLLALLGGALGIAVGVAVNRLLSGIPLETEFPLALDVQFDWRVLTYTFFASTAAGILAGLVPALRGASGSLRESLDEGGRGAISTPHRWRSALAAVQIGGSVALLVAAALFTRSLTLVKAQDFGFDARGVLNLKVSPRQTGMTERQGNAFYRDLLGRVRALPGVESASLTSSIPLGDDSVELPVEVPGYEVRKNERMPTAECLIVSTGYLATMRMRLVKGRDFSEADAEYATKVAIVNEQMADRFWPAQNPVGRQFTVVGDPRQTLQIVGIVNNSRITDVDGPPTMAFYIPAAQSYLPYANLQVRTSGRPEGMLPAIPEIIRAIQPTMPVYGVRTMEQSLNGINGLRLYSIGAWLAASMGMVGLLLAVVGVYGVMSYSVSQRRHEIGIRIALGARPADILYMISRQGLTMIAVGLACGFAAASAVGRLLRGFLAGVTDTDAFTYIGVSACLGLVAMLASYVPARRAARVDPLDALRRI